MVIYPHKMEELFSRAKSAKKTGTRSVGRIMVIIGTIFIVSYYLSDWLK